MTDKTCQYKIARLGRRPLRKQNGKKNGSFVAADCKYRPLARLGTTKDLVAGRDGIEVFAGGDVGEIILFAQAAVDVAGDASG